MSDIFIEIDVSILVVFSDIMVRQAAISFKCMLLIHYKNSRGRDYRKQVAYVTVNQSSTCTCSQFSSFNVSNSNDSWRPMFIQGQMLTLVEYILLLYRALLPAPVWYRFFLNKGYGSVFSSLTTGLYLTFKLTSIVEKVWFSSNAYNPVYMNSHAFFCSYYKNTLKDDWILIVLSYIITWWYVKVQSFIAALKALTRKEIHYGSYATAEQVSWSIILASLNK